MTTFTGTITATDGSGQTATATVTLNEVAKLTVSVAVTPASGPPGTKFTITATASGGTAPYTYAIGPINGVQPVLVSPGVWTVIPA